MGVVEPRHALWDGFSRWLDEFGPRFSIQAKRALDPFSSSMRSSARTVPWLSEIEQGLDLSPRDKAQAIGDMARALLVTGTYPHQQLTELGERALHRWRVLGVDDQETKHEEARCAALFAEAYRLRAQRYVRMYDFWCRLIEIRPAEYWWRDVYTLYLPSYLDHTDSRGFNPFRILVAADGDDLLGAWSEWTEWADDVSSDSLVYFLKKVKSERPGGRKAFCMGMETYRLARQCPRLLPEKLQEWGNSHG